MKILEVFGEPIFFGGQDTFVIDFLTHMDLSGMRVDVFTPYTCKNEHFKERVKYLGGNVIETGLDFNPGKSRLNIVSGLKKCLKKNKYDIVHVHSGSISVLALTAFTAKQNGIRKVIVHSHCGIEKITWKNMILRQIGNIFMRPSVDVYCACSRVAGEAKFTDKICKNSLRVLNNGVDLEKYRFNALIRKKIRDNLGIDDGIYLIGHVGRFAYQKNHEFLIDIYSEFNKVEPKSILVLLGDGVLKTSIEEKIKTLGLSDKVFCMGNVDNVYEYLQAFDIFLLPSRYEGLPIVGVEAQAAGLPVIVSDRVSEELKMLDNFEYLSIENGTDIWVKKMQEFKKLPRVDVSDQLRNYGYDITQTANQIRKIYMA